MPGIPRGTKKACDGHFPGPLLLFRDPQLSVVLAKRAGTQDARVPTCASVHGRTGEGALGGYGGSVPSASWSLFPPLPLLFTAAQENLPFHCWLKVIRNIVALAITVKRNPSPMALQTNLETM